MPLNFLNPVKQEYVSHYIPAPVQEIAQTGEVLQNVYDTTLLYKDKIQTALENEQVLAGDDPIKQARIEKTKNLLKEYASKGNWEDAQYIVQQVAKDYMTDQDLAKAKQSYLGFKEREELLKKYGASKALDFSPIDPKTYSTLTQGVYSPRVEQRKDWEQKRFSFFDNIPVTGFDGKVKTLSEAEALKKGYPGMSITERSSQMGISKDRIERRATEALPNYLQTEEGVQEFDALTKIEGYSPEQAKQIIKDRMVKSGLERVGFVTKTEYMENTAVKRTTSGGGGDNPFNIGNWTQRRSAEFESEKTKNPITLNEQGDIRFTADTKQAGPIFGGSIAGTFNMSDFYDNTKQSIQSKINDSNSIERKRLVNFLEERGTLKPGSSKKEQNEAISKFWNEELAIAQASIAIPKPGDKPALDVVEQMNRAYFGTTDPNVPAKGESILSGQAAQASFTDEKGQVLPPKAMYNRVKNKNVRVNGFVKDYIAPFEYGSSYMVATDPKTGDTEHFLISPDDNVKNSGGYFANRIYNSTRSKNLVTEWNDGFGNTYEATPIKGGAGFLLYINDDKTTPISLSKTDLETLSNYGSEAIQIFAELYKTKKGF